MINSRKKGFTLVELVIVIAVVAILAAVLIPTFSSLVKKANVSNDTALVKNLNTALVADVDGHETMSEVLEAAKEFGYDIAKIQAKADKNKILWDSKNDCFVYLDSEKGLVYIPDSKKEEPKNYELWVISDKVDDEYSTYLYGYTGATVEAKHGLDVGECAVTEINYATKATETVVINTNGGVLRIDAENATVNHYGNAQEVYVNDVAAATYNLYGNAGYIEVAASEHVVLKQGSSVTAVLAPGNNVNIENGQDNVLFTEGNSEEIRVNATSFSGGDGTKTTPYLIAQPEQFLNISKISKAEVYYSLVSDLDMSNVPAGYDSAYVNIENLSQIISLDLNNHTMSNVYYQLFDTVCKIEVFNGTIDFYSSELQPRSLAIVNTLSYDAEIEAKFYNLTINGSIYSTSAHFGPIVMYGYSLNTYKSNVYLENIISNVDINNQYTNAYSGGLLGYIGGTMVSLTVKNCEYNGSLSSAYAAGFAGACTSPNTLSAENNKLTGTVVGTNSALTFGGKDKNYNNTVISSGIVVKSINDPSLFEKTDDLKTGEEFIINHTNAAVSYYKVSYMFWVSYDADVEAGRPTGYPRSFEFKIEVKNDDSYNTGIYKNKVVQADSDRSTQANRIVDIESGDGCVVWKEGDTYYIYSTKFTLVNTMNSTVYIYGYNSSNAPVVFAQYGFNLNK